jgi:hypothetical protein
MKRAILGVVVLVCIAAVAPVPQSLIVPPAGWVRENLPPKVTKHGIALAQWLNFDRGDEEYVEIGYRPSLGLSARDYVAYVSVSAQREGFVNTSSRALRTCNGETGWFIATKRTNYPRAPRAEFVFVVNGSRIYYANYSYPASLPPLAKAQAAVRSLCLHGRVVSNIVPAPPVKFVAPSGWLQSNPATFGEPMWPGTIGLFLSPSGTASLALMKEPGPGDADPSDTASARSAENAEKSHVMSYQRQTMQLEQVCGHTAAFVTYRATYGDRKIDAEDILVLGPTMYVASYMRAAGSPEDSSARAALQTLCPPVTDAMPPSGAPEQVPVSIPSPMSSVSPTVIQPTPSAR